MDYTFNNYPIKFRISHYQNNGSLAIIMMTGYEMYGTLTVNLPDSFLLPEDTQFVDENNLPGIGKWLEDNELATPTETIQQSGFCTYRAYKFNLIKMV